jgi:hypothetical protein
MVPSPSPVIHCMTFESLLWRRVPTLTGHAHNPNALTLKEIEGDLGCFPYCC